MVKAPAAAATRSLKVMTTGDESGTPAAPFDGDVPVTSGRLSITAPCAVTEKSSIARPWSVPGSSGSCQRSQISWPAVAVSVSVADFGTRLFAVLPSSAAAVAVATGPVKLNEGNVVQPALGVFAPVMAPALATWYWNVSVWGVALPPLRHCSPT